MKRRVLMKIQHLFFRRRTLCAPTGLGIVSLASLFFGPLIWWFYRGESFLSASRRIEGASLLIVEGWIGPEGLAAAKAEFEAGNYALIVTSGGTTITEGWERGGWNYASGAAEHFIRSGVPREKILAAPALGSDSGRTYSAARVVREKLDAFGLHPKAVNVFTAGTHAGRSALVFSKILGPKIKVGVIAWQAPGEDRAAPWWRNSKRARNLITESAGFFYELFLNSGRA
jgi:uncharacterized SAM-binding protein YcdF (DUF218 family)